MGGNLTAFKNADDVHKIIKEMGGENYAWEEIKRKYKNPKSITTNNNRKNKSKKLNSKK